VDRSVKQLVLASASPRRRELLASLGWPFKVVVSDVDEAPLGDEKPEAMARRLATLKAQSVASQFPHSYVIGSDTVVAIDGRVLGKPVDQEESLKMLCLLNGRTHRVYSGVALCYDQKTLSDVECTEVTFRSMKEEDLQNYAKSGEGLDKAGSYAIQGRGALLVRSICGCYYNVVGLPLFRLSCLLEEAGFPLTMQWRLSEK
jgi:septum formation protein